MNIKNQIKEIIELDKDSIKRGRYVRIHPELTSDPFNKRGQVGKIIKYNKKNDEFVVRFKDNSFGTYEGDTFIEI